MIKYEIRKVIGEISAKEKPANGCVLRCRDLDPEVVESFDTLEEAREALKKYQSSARYMSSTVPVYRVEEFYIEENEYDEDGDWIGGDGGVWDYAEGLED